MSKKFDEVIEEVRNLHAVKSVGYGTRNDEFANIRASKDLGVSPKMGLLLRMNDKWHRVKQQCQGVETKDEKLRDNMIDLATYAMIWLALDNEEGA